MDRFEAIRQWAACRDLIEGSTPAHQLCKLMKEIGELAEGISKKRLDAVADGIGDAAVVLTILAAQHGMDIEQCIDLAWEQIRWRLSGDNEVGRSATSSLAGGVSAGDPGADAQGPGVAGTTDEPPTQPVHGKTTRWQQPGGCCRSGGHLSAQCPPD